MSKSQGIFYTFVSFVLFFYILYIGKDILVPFTIAVLVWYLSHSISSFYTLFWPKKFMNVFVRILLTALGITSVFALLFFIFWGLSSNMGDILKEMPNISNKLIGLGEMVLHKLNIEHTIDFSLVKQYINIEAVVKNIALNITSTVSVVFMIFVYAIFLILEQNSFNEKLAKLFKDKKNQSKAQKMVRSLDNKIKKYFLLKTLVAGSIALVSYVTMVAVGLHFAVFFAVLIFLLGYIPTIGSIIATALPVLYSLTQYESLHPIIILLVGIGAAQVIIGNILEPKLMGNSLNLSPVVLLLSLVIWGEIWGLTGMFLSVPLMVSLNLFLSEFESTRSISILLSKDGNVEE